MTIDEAIKRFRNNAEYERTNGNLQGCLEFRQLAEWLKDYKRLLGQGSRWIPVSERLPEKNVEVLVTTEWDCITIGERFSNNDWFIHDGSTTTDIDDIQAWMPLPTPYKAEREE